MHKKVLVIYYALQYTVYSKHLKTFGRSKISFGNVKLWFTYFQFNQRISNRHL